MTIYGWDASHYDAYPGARDGIDFYTHKCAEGHHFYRDTEYRGAMAAARSLGIPVLGAYFVNHPGTVGDQVDWFVSLVGADTPWWKQVPWIWQIDAEKFSYMSRAPNLSEINGFADLLCSRTASPASSVLVYAPKWLYGDTLKGLRYRLWASAYGTNPAVHYPSAYPGDTSTRWNTYSGQTPVILQYGSRTIIAGQTTCDANAFRGTLAQLRALISPQPLEEDVNEAQNNALAEVWVESVALRSGGTAPATGTKPAGPVWLVEQVKQMRAELAAIRTGVAAVGDVDEQAVAASVLAVLSPQAIAAAMPDELAAQVATELASRLAA